MAERKSGPVKPPVIDLKAREASQPAEAAKPAAKPASPKSSTAKPKPEAETKPEMVAASETVAEKPAEPKPEPEPARPIPTPPSPPTPPPVRQARLAMPWSAISIAAVAGALLGTALTYALVNLVPMPSSAPVIADPAEQLADLEGRLGAIETRVPALEESGLDTQVSLDATITQMDSGLAEVRSRLTGLENRVSEVQASVAATTPVDLGPITAQLDALQGRVAAIAAGASSADAAALADSINSIEAGVTELTSRLDAADKRLGEIDAIRAELETSKAAIAAQTQTLGGANIGPAIKLPLVVAGLETAFAAGRPYTAELESLRALLPDLAVPEALAAAAATGLQRPDALENEFRAMVPTILAGRTAESTGDWGKDAIEWTKALLALRPSGEIEGDTPEAIMSRLEAAMERRDFIASATLLDQLPAPMQVAAGEVATSIRARAEADRFVAGLRAQALAPVAEATP